MPHPSAAIVDTDVLSLLFITSVVISFHTRAEVLAGVYEARWGRSRVSDMLTILDRTPTVESSQEVVEAFARLRADAKTVGHPIAHDLHTGDSGIAACAITVGLPLLTGNDKHFSNAPDLELLTWNR